MPGSEGGLFIMEDGTSYFVGKDNANNYPISGNPLNSWILKTDFVEVRLFTAFDAQKMSIKYNALNETGRIICPINFQY